MPTIKNILRLLHVKYLQSRGGNKSQIETTGRVLIIAPHPDDEVIGCGGLIARLVAEGKTPHIIIMTGGEGSHRGCCNTPDSEITAARRILTHEALDILGVPEENIYELNFPDGGIDIENTEISSLKTIISEINPSCIFVPHWAEGWSDHVKTAEIIKHIAPSDTQIWEYCVWMWFYNVWRGLDWKNAAVLKMAPHEHALKLRAIDAYVIPTAPCGHPWSGVLPDVFLNANRWNKELYFKIQ